MSGTVRAGSYRSLLADGPTARTFVLSAAGRGGYAMLPLIVLFTVNEATHSFQLAPFARSAAALLLPWSVLVASAGVVGIGAPMLGILVLAGAAGAPLWIVAYLAADRSVPKGVRTEANTWVTTAANLGTTAGTATAGVLSAIAIRLPLFAAAGVAVSAALATLSAGGARCRRSVSADR